MAPSKDADVTNNLKVNGNGILVVYAADFVLLYWICNPASNLTMKVKLPAPIARVARLVGSIVLTT